MASSEVSEVADFFNSNSNYGDEDEDEFKLVDPEMVSNRDLEEHRFEKWQTEIVHFV